MDRPKTIVYIDGFNLYYGCIKDTPYRWLDLFRFAQANLPQNDVVAVKYFTAIVKPPATDPGKRTRQLAFLRALGNIPEVEIFYGSFQSNKVQRPRATGGGRVWIVDMKEKGSDVNLATELLCDGFSGNYDVAAVVSNDSDLVAPIRAVIDRLGKSVGVINPHIRKHSRPSVEMKKCCTFYRTVHKKTLRDSQMPDVLQDRNGSIHKPPEWWIKSEE